MRIIYTLIYGLQFIKRHWIGVSLLVLVVITALSLWPQQQLPVVPGTDKLHHFIAYALLMLPVGMGVPHKRFVSGSLLIAYSGMLEVLQPYVNRYGDFLDLAANISGVLFSIILSIGLDFVFKYASENSFQTD